MSKPAASCRRIDQLRAIAFKNGFTNEDARAFGKLTKTSTWEALCQHYYLNIPETAVDTVDTYVNSLVNYAAGTEHNSTNFLDWVDLSQLIAVALASAGVFVLAMGLWRQINPLNLFPPVHITIQIGAKK